MNAQLAEREPALLLAAALAAEVALGLAPQADRLTWSLENAPVWLGAPLLAATRRRFPLTPLSNRLLLAHALVLMVGGHYTYAKVPLGDWLRDRLGLKRNPYDRFGHLAQGFIPVIVMREILLRRGAVRRSPWLVPSLLLMTLGISAAYELIEWGTSAAAGGAADQFLGTQGDQWDTQWDMFCALLGAGAALALLSGAHDRALAALDQG